MHTTMRITPRHLGLIYCLGYVFLEAFQAVYLGSLFQQVDSFRIGAWVFGLSLLACSLLAGVMLSVISGAATAYDIFALD